MFACSCRAAFARVFRFGAPLAALFVIIPDNVAFAEEQARGSVIEEVIVTAQKREESINDVGMSIQAATGEKLNDLGITDTADLYKVVSGFNSNVTYYGTSIYTIRGVGFQDTALASGPTVSVYLDQMPLPFSALTQGLILDLERVEALKGPQGTLFGQNSTGGAVNYIAKKPTTEFSSGIDASYGRFNEFDISAFVSGPISDTLSYRLAARSITSDGWQEAVVDNPAPDPFWIDQGRNYTRSDDEWGEKDFLSYRASMQWDPSERFSALLSFSGFIDEGQTQAPQLYGIASLNPDGDLNPLVANYPRAGNDNRDADWGACVNVAGGSPDLAAHGLGSERRRHADQPDQLRRIRSGSATGERRHVLPGLRVVAGRLSRRLLPGDPRCRHVPRQRHVGRRRQLRRHVHVGQLRADVRYLVRHPNPWQSSGTNSAQQPAELGNMGCVREFRLPDRGRPDRSARHALHRPGARLPRLRRRRRRRHVVRHFRRHPGAVAGASARWRPDCGHGCCGAPAAAAVPARRRPFTRYRAAGPTT